MNHTQEIFWTIETGQEYGGKTGKKAARTVANRKKISWTETT